MPELPEVELCAANLRAWCVGRTIRAVTAAPGPPLRGDTTPERLEVAMTGHAITAVERHGKQLLMRTSGPSALLLHLGMTGAWTRDRAGARLVLELDDGPVAMADVRRLGRVRVVLGADTARAPELAKLGPDALAEVGVPGRLAARLSHVTVPIKVALMDQARVAGVGNIYAAEACFDARIDPRRPARALSASDFDRLGASIVRAMERTLDEGRRNPDFAYISEGGENTFAVYGREGLPCPRCGVAIERFEQASRSTYACPTCQASPRNTPKKKAKASKTPKAKPKTPKAKPKTRVKTKRRSARRPYTTR